MQVSGGRAFQAEGAASARALWQEEAWYFQAVPKKPPDWVEENEQGWGGGVAREFGMEGP